MKTMNSSFRKIGIAIALAFFAIGMSACNTMKGIGEDTEVAGEKIQKEADSHIKDKDKSNDSTRNRR